ncbi:MAG TPA: glycerophosphodiester phosphodiesterase [Steroidobacteraceae bacterium]|nr:glycerophosphodiester phosphodiesterase [Steroidobacteraceae bacterium]
MTGTPVIIAHRGASGYLPEHTLPAYFVAIQQGADYVEPDLVVTKDGVLVARHENEISGTTDVAQHPEFADRRTTKTIDGEAITGWFTEDFTLAELKTLRARERLPQLRPANARLDGAFQIPTFDEVLELVRGADRQRAAAARARGLPTPERIGVYPETKHPSYFASIGLPFDEPLLRSLSRHDFRTADDPAFIQSFEVANLQALRQRTKLRLVQLVAPNGQPYDFARAKDPRSYLDMLTPAGLRAIAAYADAIGPHKEMVVAREADGSAGQPTGLAALARAAGLGVHVWTLRAENDFLPVDLRRGSEPGAMGDMRAEVRALLNAGVTGVFADHPDIAAAARADWQQQQR